MQPTANDNSHPTAGQLSPMTLRVHLEGAPSYVVGDEIWHESLTEVIAAEAETITTYVGPGLSGSAGQASCDSLRDRVVAEMTSALRRPGDRYRAPDGVLYSLASEPGTDRAADGDTLRAMTSRPSQAIVEEVLRFENLPIGSSGTRRAIVRWSDGSEGPALTWYGDEILVCEGDLVGKSRDQIRSLHFRRDRDWLQS